MRLIAEEYLDIAAAVENFNRHNRGYTSIGKRVTIAIAFIGATLLFLTSYHGAGAALMFISPIGFATNHLPLRIDAYFKRRHPYRFK